MSDTSTPEQSIGGSGSGRIGSIRKTNEDSKSKHTRWKDEIYNAEKEGNNWHELGRKIVQRYKDDRKGSIDTLDKKFNLFTTNVGILQAALYSHVPKVDVERRFHDADDDVARVAANIMQRAITQDLDETHCDFSQVMEDAIEDRLVPGAGFAWLRLKVETEQVPLPVPELPAGMNPATAPEPTESKQEMVEQITNQEIVVEHVHWEDFLYSPCRTWAERRWVGRKVYMDLDSMTARFGEKIAKQVPLDYSPKLDTNQVTPLNDVLKKACIYEIWDRQTRTVVWLSKGYNDLLDERPDPLRLEGFEPCPKPLFALTTTSNCVPTADYYLLQDQYKELDDVNDRIASLHRACKVVGVYDKSADGIQRMLSEGSDNQMIPVDNWAMFAEKGGIKGQVDWVPLDMVVLTLQNLRQAREDIKGQIYELNGISDVVRGASKASETLGAQQIKANFANIRIQRLQGSAARFASEIFRIKAEILAKHFTPEIIIKMSGIQYTPDWQNPDLIQAAMELVKNEEEFEWRVTVDSDSMKMADYAQEKKDRSEFATSIATYLQSSATLLGNEPTLAPMLFGMMKYVAAGFPGSKDMEGLIDKTIHDLEEKAKQPPPPPPPDPKVMQMQQQAQIDAQADQRKSAMDAQEMQNKHQEAILELQQGQQELAQQREQFQQEMMQDRARFLQEMEQERAKAAQQLDIAEAKAAAKPETEEP